jgi:hypothetical protein
MDRLLAREFGCGIVFRIRQGRFHLFAPGYRRVENIKSEFIWQALGTQSQGTKYMAINPSVTSHSSNGD